REYEWAKTLSVVTIVIFLVWFIARTKVVLAPFILGAIVGYLFNPIVDKLERMGVRRTLGIVTIAVPIVLLIVLVFIVFIPKLVAQLQELFAAIPTFYSTLEQHVTTILERLRERGIIIEERELLDEAIRRSLPLVRNVLSGAINVMKGLGAVITFFTYLIVIPIVSFYWMRDSSRIYARLHSLIPRRYRALAIEFRHETALVFERYVRGQIVLSAIVGTLTAVLLWAFRIDYFILLGILAGVFNIVPRIGFILSIIPALLVAAFTHSVPLLGMTWVIVVFIVVVVAETIISPRILGSSMRLHPVTVLLAILVGAIFFGVIGLVLAVPVVAIAKLFLLRLEQRYLTSQFYRRRSTRSTK
ncbi:hypothetical protein AMJ40_05670, partial [candidate division TA06 bacterium DG_26]